MSNSRGKRKPMANINVVPYIDVMLVLLVIFMVTAPLLQSGVELELPQADAKPITESDIDPIIVTVDKDGLYYLNIWSNPNQSIDAQTLLAEVQAVLQRQSKTPVLVRGDRKTEFQHVVTAMARLQQAGVAKVGMMTEQIPSN